LAEAPGVLQDLIISRLISPWSAIEVLAWQNTEHYDAIMHEIGAWCVEGEELPRARVREIIKEITEPSAPYGCQLFPVAAFVREGEIEPGTMVVINTDGKVAPANCPEPKDPTCRDCGNSTWSGGELVCAHHGPVNPDGRYCEKFVAPSLGDEDDPVDDEEGGCEMFGVPGAADDEVCAVDCPDYDACKSEAAANEDEDDEDLPDEHEPVNDGLMITERPEDFVGNMGVPMILGKHDSSGYHVALNASDGLGDDDAEVLVIRLPAFSGLDLQVSVR
jgi:hypothetical protein